MATKKPVSPKPSAGRSNIAGKRSDAVSLAAKKREDVLRQQLLQKRNELLVEARHEISKYIKGETRQLVESVLDDADWSVIDLSEDVNLRRLSAHQTSLVKIDESLRKLREGTYGTCEDCGEAISAERLKVMLFAIYCKDCQENMEEIEKVEKEEL
ncbi:MAG: TraR/DksA C4-type zinc finger protein [Nitrospirota bacterium]|jgi:DnaK suppressor protein